jgi:hypothetical protein
MPLPLRLCLSILVFIAAGRVVAQSYHSIAELHYGYDSERRLLVARVDPEAVNYPVLGIRTLGKGGGFLALPHAVSELKYDTLYPATSGSGEQLQIAFTRLPIVHLRTAANIHEWSKEPGRLTYADREQTVVSDIGLRHRGSFSLRYPKKSLDLEFWDAPTGRKSRDVQFAHLREDDDWVLDALYNEPLRVNAYVAHQLWLDLHRPYYREREEGARAGANLQFTEVFYNDRYHGLYLLSEQVDRKQLGLKKVKDGAIRGELYKAVDWTNATRILAPLGEVPAPSAPHYDGWELKHPEPGDGIGWGPLHELLSFATRSSDAQFIREASEWFHLDNLIDYFIFVNATTLIDNTGKNSYLARYREEEPYFYVPWDLDASFGNRYDATRNQDVEQWLTNGLQDRLLDLNPDDYSDRFCERYRELRADLLDPAVLNDRIDEAVSYLESTGALTREALAWPGSVDYGADYRAFVKNWNEQRIAYLDEAICEPLVSTAGVRRVEELRIAPNPAATVIRVERSAPEPEPYVVRDVTGRTVLRGQMAGRMHQVTISGLTPGIYFIQTPTASTRLVVHR